MPLLPHDPPAFHLDAPAMRPTDGGLWSFDATDDVRSYDVASGRVRVWYSAAGTNVVLDGDADADGVPDFAQSVGATAEDVIDVFGAAGFRPLISDAGDGGSDALDIYLVDFAGNADGAWSSEGCDREGRCSGWFAMENDFSGYGYRDIDTAVRVLVSHELFHGVQAAYTNDMPVWLSEGVAVWAEHLYDPENEDFLRFCDAYLDDTGRSLDEPPAGPVPTFAYATGLWWWFLADRHGDDALVALMEATDGGGADPLAEMDAILTQRGDALRDAWVTFASWNGATGGRAGGTSEGYPFASRIGPPRSEDEGATLDVEDRVYPLAAVYYDLAHPGGPLTIATDAAAPDLHLAVHPYDTDGALLDAVAELDGAADVALVAELGEVDAGDYLLVVSNPTLAEQSTRVRLCVGAEAAACAPADADTGDPAGDTAEESGGCGCATGSGGAGGMTAVAAVLLAALRRRGRARQPAPRHGRGVQG
jgi:MYXO-CTERM domain-containing protein